MEPKWEPKSIKNRENPENNEVQKKHEKTCFRLLLARGGSGPVNQPKSQQELR